MAALVCLSLPVFYLLWIVFTGSSAMHELLIGILAALSASAGLLVVNFQYPARFTPTLVELLSCWRVPWYVLSGTWEITSVAIQDLLNIKATQSLFRVAPFHAGQEDDRRATARRVLAIAYTTMAPNFIILGINASDEFMLFHQIERSDIPKMTRTLGAVQ